MKRSLIAVTVMVVMMLNSCVRCDKLAEKAVEKGIEKSIELESGGKAKADIDIGRGVKLPSDFPRELVPPGGKAVGKFSINAGEGASMMVSFESHRSMERVASYYRNLKGWKVVYSSEFEDGINIGLAREESIANISITEEDGKTSVVVNFGREKR